MVVCSIVEVNWEGNNSVRNRNWVGCDKVDRIDEKLNRIDKSGCDLNRIRKIGCVLNKLMIDVNKINKGSK